MRALAHQVACVPRAVKPDSVDFRYNWTRAWLNIMFFRASMDSLHGTASTSLADWPRSECQLRPPPSSTAAVPTTSAAPSRANHLHPQYGVKFAPFVLRPDNKILVQDGSSRDSISTMLKACRLIARLLTVEVTNDPCRIITVKILARIILS